MLWTRMSEKSVLAQYCDIGQRFGTTAASAFATFLTKVSFQSPCKITRFRVNRFYPLLDFIGCGDIGV